MARCIEISEAARRDLGRLDRQVAGRTPRFPNDRVVSFADPRDLGEALQGPVLGRFWTYGVGDHRVIVEIRDGGPLVLVVKIGNRRDVCRRRPASVAFLRRPLSASSRRARMAR